MLTSQTRYETENGSKYLQQLCKHFAHKVTVDYTETEGQAALPPGPARMSADAGGLTVTVTAQDQAGLAQARFIIEDHLTRFAHRENLTSLEWIDA